MTDLCVDDLPAALHQLGLLEEPALAEQEARVAGRQAGLQVADAGPRQERYDILFGRVQRRQDRVRFGEKLVRIEVSEERIGAWVFIIF